MRKRVALALIISCSLTVAAPAVAVAADQVDGAVGLQGIIPSPPPKRGATIAVPSNGATFTDLPVTVAGTCPAGLLVKVFSNNVFVGSTVCSNSGSFSVQVDLFPSRNDLSVKVYDSLDQAGPDSNTVTVYFNSAQYLQSGTFVTLSSAYAERGAAPGTELDWPIEVSGGTAPYAISVDWGDGSAADLMSVTSAGNVTIKHTYKVAGIYKVVIKASDKNGTEAFLQVVGQATGAIQGVSKNSGSSVVVRKEVLWWPALETLPLILAAFWLGRRHELFVRTKQIEEAYHSEDEARQKPTK